LGWRHWPYRFHPLDPAAVGADLMPRRNMVIDSTPSPQNITIIMALLRAAIIILGAAGVTTAEYTDAQLMPLAGALAVIFGLSWQVYEQFRQGRMRHDAAVASAKGAAAVQHIDYQPVAVPLNMVRVKK
jgi:hypothetical protein